MTITLLGQSAIGYSSAGGTSVTVGYPTGATAGEKLILVVGQKPSTANGGTATATAAAGWTLVTSFTAQGGYGTTLGADTGNTNLYVFERTILTGQTPIGAETVTLGTNNVAWGQMFLFGNASGAWGTTDWSSNPDTTGAASLSITGNSSLDGIVGDLYLGAFCMPTDAVTGFTGEAFSQSGLTFSTAVELGFPDSGTGNDIGGLIAYATVTAGTSTAQTTFTATASGTTTNVRGPGIIVRLREQPAVEAGTTDTVTASDSSNATVNFAHAVQRLEDTSNKDGNGLLSIFAPEPGGSYSLVNIQYSATGSAGIGVVFTAQATGRLGQVSTYANGSTSAGSTIPTTTGSLQLRNFNTDALIASAPIVFPVVPTTIPPTITQLADFSNISGADVVQGTKYYVSIVPGADWGVANRFFYVIVGSSAGGYSKQFQSLIGTSGSVYVRADGSVAIKTATILPFIDVQFSSTVVDSANTGDIFANLTESVTATDTTDATVNVAVAGATTETVTASDSADSIVFLNTTRTESVTADHSQSTLLDAVASQAETLSAAHTDTAANITDTDRAESLTATDAQSSSFVTTSDQAETTTVSDSADFTFAAGGAVTESVTADHSQTNVLAANALGTSLDTWLTPPVTSGFNSGSLSPGAATGITFISGGTAVVSSVSLYTQKLGAVVPSALGAIELWELSSASLTAQPSVLLASIPLRITEIGSIGLYEFAFAEDTLPTVEAGKGYAVLLRAGSDWSTSTQYITNTRVTFGSWLSSITSRYKYIAGSAAPYSITNSSDLLAPQIQALHTVNSVELQTSLRSASQTESLSASDSADSVINKTFEVDITEYDDATDFTRAYGPTQDTADVVEELIARDAPRAVNSLILQALEGSFLNSLLNTSSNSQSILNGTAVGIQFVPIRRGELGLVSIRAGKANTNTVTTDGSVEVWEGTYASPYVTKLGEVPLVLSSLTTSFSNLATWDFSQLGIVFEVGKAYAIRWVAGTDWTTTPLTNYFNVNTLSSTAATSPANQMRALPYRSFQTNGSETTQQYFVKVDASSAQDLPRWTPYDVVDADVTEAGSAVDASDAIISFNVIESVSASDSPSANKITRSWEQDDNVQFNTLTNLTFFSSSSPTLYSRYAQPFVATKTGIVGNVAVQIGRSNTITGTMPVNDGSVEIWQLAGDVTSNPQTLLASVPMGFSSLTSATPGVVSYYFGNVTLTEGVSYAVVIVNPSDFSSSTQYLTICTSNANLSTTYEYYSIQAYTPSYKRFSSSWATVSNAIFRAYIALETTSETAAAGFTAAGDQTDSGAATDEQDGTAFQNNLIDEAVTSTDSADNTVSTSVVRAESVNANENSSNTKVAYDITLDDGVLWSNIGLWGGTTNRNSSFTPVTITPKTSGLVTRFSIGLDRIDNPNLATITTGTLVIRQTNNSGAILCSQSYSFSQVSAFNRGITNIDLDTPITMVAGSTYWVGLTSGADWGGAASFTTYYNNVASFGAYAFNWSTSNGLTAAGQDAYRIRLLSDIALDTAFAGFTAASSIDETNTALDSINAISEQNLYVDEIVAISDAQLGGFSAPVDRSEALTSSDVYSTYLDAVANISESVTWIDQQQNTLVAVTQATEAVSPTDSSVNSNAAVSNISEAASLVSFESGVFTAVAFEQETVSSSDYVVNYAVRVASTTETTNALEESFRGVSLFAQSDEAALLDELSESKFAVSTYFEETFSLTDAVTNYVSTFGSAIEQAAGEDSPSTTVDTFAVIKESRLVSESNVVNVNFSSLVSEDVSLADDIGSSIAFYTVASEGILFIDSYGATYSVVVSVEEPVFALDTTSRQLILVVSGDSDLTATTVASLYRAMTLSGLAVGDISTEARLQLRKLVAGSAVASLDLNGRLIKITPMNLADVQARSTSAYTYVATVNSATDFGDVSMDVYTYNVDASVETMDSLGAAIMRIESVAYISVSMYTADISMTAEVVYADFESASINLAA